MDAAVEKLLEQHAGSVHLLTHETRFASLGEFAESALNTLSCLASALETVTLHDEQNAERLARVVSDLTNDTHDIVAQWLTIEEQQAACTCIDDPNGPPGGAACKMHDRAQSGDA